MGNVVGFVGFLIIFLRWRGSTEWYESVFVALPGMGMGIMQSTTFVHLAASLEQSDIAIAGSSWFLAQNVGILIGSSLSTATINRRTSSLLDSYLDGIEDKAEVSKRGGIRCSTIVDMKTARLLSASYQTPSISRNCLKQFGAWLRTHISRRSWLRMVRTFYTCFKQYWLITVVLSMVMISFGFVATMTMRENKL